MFQNIVDELDEKNTVINNSVKIKNIVKEIFKYQNVIIYILTFFLSMISLESNIMTFAMAILAACVGSAVPVVGIMVISCVSITIFQGGSALISYLITALIYFALIFIFKPKVAVDERNEILKTGSRLLLASLIVTYFNIHNGLTFFYSLFISAVYSGIAYVFYKIFVNGLIVLKSFNEKKAFTIEELVGATVILAVASIAFQNINLFNINISHIIVLFILMFLGWKNGTLISATVGISMGLILSILGSGDMTLIGIFAVSGFFSGLLNKLGKFGAIIGALLGTALVTYLAYNELFFNVSYIEIIIAGIILLLVPKKLHIELEDLIGNNKLLTDIGENRLTSNDEVSDKLNILSNTILNTTREIENESINREEEYIQNFLDSLEEYKDNFLYEELSTNEAMIADIYKTIIENEIIVEKNLISIFEKYNNYIFMQDEQMKNDLQEIVKMSNRVYKMQQIDIIKKTEIKNQAKALNEKLKNVSKVISKCANDIVKNDNPKNLKLEDDLKNILQLKNIKINAVKVNQAKNGKYIITLGLEFTKAEQYREKSKIVNISDVISRTIGSKVGFQKDFKDIEKQEYYQTYSTEDKYIMQVGTARISEENSKMSGDCSLQIRINDGKYILAIADGMGTGAKAREKSKLAIQTLKKLLESGFEKQESVSLINSILNTNNQNDSYTSMDITILDLYTGVISTMKNGACNTYIKSKKNIKTIISNKAPIGIIENIEVEAKDFDISDGDIIVMCSDGVLESKDAYKKDWLEEFLKNISTNNVQKVADMIIAEAIDNSYGIANDDMTVIVAKIMKKNNK